MSIRLAGGADQVEINSDGKLLINTDTAQDNLRPDVTFDQKVAIVSNTNRPTGIRLTQNAGATAATAPIIDFRKTRGTTDGSHTVVANGDELGKLSFGGADGTDNESEAASIYVEVDGTPGANAMPGAITFATSANGAASPTPRMIINSSGHITTPHGPAFLVNRASLFTSGSDTRVPYDSVRFNRGNHFDASAGQHRFNVPVSGVYYFFASCYRNPVDTNSGFGSIRIFVNNTTYFAFTEYQPFSNNAHHYTMATLNLSAGDFVSVNASAFRVDSNSFFGGYLIG